LGDVLYSVELGALEEFRITAGYAFDTVKGQ
jgi:hypothetical protein